MHCIHSSIIHCVEIHLDKNRVREMGRNALMASIIAHWLARPFFTKSCSVCAKQDSDSTPASRRPAFIFLALSRRKTCTLELTFHVESTDVTSPAMLLAVCDSLTGEAARIADYLTQDGEIQCAEMLSALSPGVGGEAHVTRLWQYAHQFVH